MKLILPALFIISFGFTSCSKKIATNGSIVTESLHNGGIKVKPIYIKKIAPITTLAANAGFAGAGYAAGYAFKNDKDGNALTSSSRRETGKYIAISAAIVSVIATVDVLFKFRKEAKYIKRKSIDKWVRKYNRVNNTNYVFVLEDSYDGDIYLAPKEYKDLFIAEEGVRQLKLKDERSLKNQKAWIGLLTAIGVAAIIIDSNDKNSSIDPTICSRCHGSGKIPWKEANKDPDVYSSSLNKVPCPDCKGTGRQ